VPQVIDEIVDARPLVMMRDGVFARGRLWETWKEAFPNSSVQDMLNFIAFDFTEGSPSEFMRSVAWLGPST
jgi:hypothetical protein